MSLALSEKLAVDFLILAKSRPVLEKVADRVGDEVTVGYAWIAV